MAETPTVPLTATDILQQLMQRAKIASYRALAEQAGVSRWQVQQLRQGKLDQMRLAAIKLIAATLQLSVAALIESFETGVVALDDLDSLDSLDPTTSAPAPSPTAEPPPSATVSDTKLEALQQEYARLQTQLIAAATTARQALQREALDTLESWLIQWPTIVHRAQANDSLAAAKVVKFVEPVMLMVEAWGVSAIAPVGTTIPYDPQYHQLKQGTAQPGDPVEVISPGYTYDDKLLHRTTVRLGQ